MHLGGGRRWQRLTTPPLVSAGPECFVPVSKHCSVLRLAWQFQISSVAVALSGCIFQRVLTRLAEAEAHGDFIQCPFSRVLRCVLEFGLDPFLHLEGRREVFRVPHLNHFSVCSIYVYIVCLHIAVKMVHIPHTVPHRLGRRYSISRIFQQLELKPLTVEELLDVEMWILSLLDWNVLPCLLQWSQTA